MTNVNEIFLPIKGYEGIYEVSNLGNVRSLDRIIKYGNNAHRPAKGCNMYKRLGRNGYLSVGLWLNNKEKRFSIHRLVADTFIDNPNQLAQVNHKNGVKVDNNVCNLEWMSASDNMKHSFRELGTKSYMLGMKGSLHWRSKKITQFTKTGERLNDFENSREAGEAIGTKNHSWISACCRGKAKTAYGFKWKFANDN